MWGLAAFAGCSKRDRGPGDDAGRRRPDPEFDQRWSALAGEDVDVFYIEDDRGEDLMGNVRRARGAATRPPRRASDSPMPPAKLSHEDVQRVIRQNLPGVRSLFQRLGQGAPAFGQGDRQLRDRACGRRRGHQGRRAGVCGTSLPSCVIGTVSRWAFPKSQKGGLAISYPFVFVGG